MCQIGLISILNSNLKYDKADEKHEFEEIISGSHYRYTFQLFTVFSSKRYKLAGRPAPRETFKPISLRNPNFNSRFLKLE